MSAFMCSDRHLSALAAFYINTVRNTDTFDEIFTKLYDMNKVAIETRYPGDAGMIGAPPVASYAVGKDFIDVHGFGAVAKLAHSYAYQACEAGDYDGSAADIIVQTVVENVVRESTSYKEGPWSA